MTFEETLQKHLSAIENREIQGFKDTVCQSDELTIIMPSGAMVKGYKDILGFHKNWFYDLDWKISFDILSTRCGEDMAYALMDTTYHDVNEKGEPYSMRYYLSTVFVKEDERWLLLFDQNTMIPKG